MIIKTIDQGQSFDFGKTAQAYSAYRDIYPPELYDRLRSLGVAADGTAWLDLGTGTGVLPKNLYNPSARITGVDISEEQISCARREAYENGRDITYIVSSAENTGLPDNGFDVITAAQCFWYFDRELIKAEISRLIKPGGTFIKIFMNWDYDDPIAAGSIALVEAYNPKWSGGKKLEEDIYDDLFPGRRTESFCADIPFTRGSWHGRMLACRGTLASMDRNNLKKWEDEHLKFLGRCPDYFTVRHKVCYSWFNIDQQEN